jgi:Dolichyl-phosphate-mannose-protein mannosyltransferase
MVRLTFKLLVSPVDTKPVNAMAGAGTPILDLPPATFARLPAAPKADRTSPKPATASPSVLGAAALIVLAGGAVRAASLAGSLWFDEAVTVRDVSGTFGQMLHRVVNHEASPPFYFICLWLWRHLVGNTAVDLRSLSAVAGTLTIALAFVVGRRRIGPRAGLVLALCVAVSPALIYYSTEMRMYGLLVLITGIGFEAFLLASNSPNRRNLSVWAAASILAVWTQYYAVLAVAPEAVLLLMLVRTTRGASRGTFVAVGSLALCGLPLTYLMLYQARHAYAYGALLLSSTWQHEPLSIHTYPSLPGVVQEIVVGPAGPARGLLTLLVLLVVLACAAHLARHRQVAKRQLIWGCCLIAPGALAVEVLVVLHLAMAGRYLLPLWLPVGLGTSYALASAGRLGIGLTGLLACIWMGLVLVVLTIPKFGARDDTLGAARSLGVATRDRLVAISQPWDVAPFEDYRPRASGATRALMRVRELDVVAMPVAGEPPPGDHERPTSTGVGALPRGLRLAQVIRGSTYLVERFVASTPVSIRIDGHGTAFTASSWRFLDEPAGSGMGSL